MPVKDILCLIIWPSVSLLCVISGVHWLPSIAIGFVASYLPYLPKASKAISKAMIDGWNHPRPR